MSIRLLILTCLAPLCVAACDPGVASTGSGGSTTGTGGSITTSTGGTGGSNTGSGGGDNACGPADWADVLGAGATGGGGSGSTGTGTPTSGGGAWSPAWAKVVLDESIGFGTHLAAHPDGTFIWAGPLDGSIDLCGEHEGHQGQTTFVAKLRADGAPLWFETFGTDNRIEALTVSPAGDIVIGGSFRDTLTLGSVTLTSEGGDDAFVAKLDAAGSAVWARSAGDTLLQQTVRGLAVDAQGDVAITGEFLGAIDWGTGPLVAADSLDMFVAKLDASGDALWAQSYGTAEPDRGGAVVLDAQGDVLARGSGAAGLDLGGAVLAEDASFLLKLDGATGTYLWSKTGELAEGSIAAGPGESYVLAYSTGSDAVLSRIKLDGAPIFEKVFTGAGSGFQLVFEAGAIGLSFTTSGVDLGGGMLGGSGKDDIAVGVFDPEGTHLYSFGFGGMYHGGPDGLAISNGTILLSGNFEESIDFGFATVENGVEDADPFLLAFHSNLSE